MKQDRAAEDGSNARFKSSCSRWRLGSFLLVLHLLVVEAHGNIVQVDEPLTRISFGSCANQSAPQPIWDAVLEFDPNLFIHLGDNIYADIKDPNKYFGKERNVGPFKKTPRFWSISPEALKIKYDLLKHGQPSYVALRKKTQIIGTWDDHDYGLNDAGKEYEGKDASQQVMLDFLDEAPDSPRRKQQGVYAAYTYGPAGKKVKVILLDTRYHRDPIHSDGTMLGEIQWRWFENELRNSDAQIHIIGSSIQVVSNFSAMSQPFFSVESWGMFPSERSRLYAVLRDTNASGVIFISGDVHFGEITRFDCGLTYPVYDITSSGLTEAVEDKAKGFPWSIILTYCSWLLPETMRVHNSRCAVKPCIYGHVNFGTFEINWEAKPVTINVNVRDIHGTPVLGETLCLPDLQPGYFKSKTVRGSHVQRHCTLEYDLPWYRKYILAFNFFAAVTVFVGALVTLLVLGVVRLMRPSKSPTLKED
ncbi:hypothetical protein KC19_9G155400 [Ceratodon purpureus]|uniref:PhoD-like phosphatase metallophosphatase domain-containing protein n=1 Tax=Ceratodon purpureus TaxID=3225 RepID=A0A8T0GXS2_CERPU|nr:hypothetical protein KC19_9G155400 [Ceratodon purpureus]